ncbi:MAG: UDP-N-acetylmuramoyl-L-alanine--D-glutamate ligase [Acidobacteria bacterium]|nr:UDP-N-acetylmuramoyl-L-alanine--D-glutamate ligase [Acidobacteriota bacterium]MBI3662410.1 UDP-N-acetylmuramoyl-L-alanine--D-glutamate ligase [Acidobacteriota bacterium]
MKLEGKRVLVVGLARTGVASALFCAARGARVTATDEKPEAELAAAAANLRAAGVELELGGHSQETFLRQELIIQSPGVPAEMACFVAARAAGVPVWSEVELAWRFLRGRLIAITGSNGKTTTTALVGHILQSAGLPTLVGGNIGTPLISLVEFSSDATLTVAEMSSFQLETIAAFRPEIGVWLNLTPDHLDRHASFQLYGQAKARLFENQTEHDAAILNADDAETPRYAPTGPRVHWFSRQRRVARGAFLREDAIVFRANGSETVLLRREDIGLRGEHNVENVLAAAAAAFLAGASPSAIAEGVRTFAGVEHRLEFVAEIGGASYYNDSKATNVDATLKAIDAFPGNLLIILGGKDKGGDFTALREALHRRARLALVIGKAAEKISEQIAGAVPVEAAGTLERAVRLAHEQARPGDVVLLAPACASFDQFENYEHRGRVFKQIVRSLTKPSVSKEKAS